MNQYFSPKIIKRTDADYSAAAILIDINSVIKDALRA